MRTVLVTGVSKGLGRYLCRYLSRDFRVAGLGLTAESELPAELSGRLHAYRRADLSDFDAEGEKICGFLTSLEIDVLINNAAVRLFGDLPGISAREITRAASVNYLAPVLLTRTVLPGMFDRGFGRIINIGSQSGLQGYSSGSIYCSSKSALLMFTESLAKDLQRGKSDVTVNMICPDAFRTIAGEEIEGGDRVLDKVATVASQIVNSNMNGEVIPVMRGQTRIIHAVKGVRTHLRRLIKT